MCIRRDRFLTEQGSAKLLYVGGYGHSGSTLLEFLLSSSPSVVACGETAGAVHKLTAARKCSCGMKAGDCPVWAPVLRRAREGRQWRHWEVNADLLSRVSGRHRAIVDSSKTAWRQIAAPFLLRRQLGNEFVLIHVVRDPRAVCWSMMRRRIRTKSTKTPALVCASAALGWLIANLACELFRWKFPAAYTRLSYEMLASSPEGVVRSLLAQEGLEYDPQLLGSNDNRHQMFGNRMRRKNLRLSEVQPDMAWQKAMPRKYQTLAWRLSTPLGRRYSYRAVTGAEAVK